MRYRKTLARIFMGLALLFSLLVVLTFSQIFYDPTDDAPLIKNVLIVNGRQPQNLNWYLQNVRDSGFNGLILVLCPATATDAGRSCSETSVLLRDKYPFAVHHVTGWYEGEQESGHLLLRGAQSALRATSHPFLDMADSLVVVAEPFDTAWCGDLFAPLKAEYLRQRRNPFVVVHGVESTDPKEIDMFNQSLTKLVEHSPAAAAVVKSTSRPWWSSSSSNTSTTPIRGVSPFLIGGTAKGVMHLLDLTLSLVQGHAAAAAVLPSSVTLAVAVEQLLRDRMKAQVVVLGECTQATRQELSCAVVKTTEARSLCGSATQGREEGTDPRCPADETPDGRSRKTPLAVLLNAATCPALVLPQQREVQDKPNPQGQYCRSTLTTTPIVLPRTIDDRDREPLRLRLQHNHALQQLLFPLAVGALPPSSSQLNERSAVDCTSDASRNVILLLLPERRGTKTKTSSTSLDDGRNIWKSLRKVTLHNKCTDVVVIYSAADEEELGELRSSSTAPRTARWVSVAAGTMRTSLKRAIAAQEWLEQQYPDSKNLSARYNWMLLVDGSDDWVFQSDPFGDALLRSSSFDRHHDAEEELLVAVMDRPLHSLHSRAARARGALRRLFNGDRSGASPLLDADGMDDSPYLHWYHNYSVIETEGSTDAEPDVAAASRGPAVQVDPAPVVLHVPSLLYGGPVAMEAYLAYVKKFALAVDSQSKEQEGRGGEDVDDNALAAVALMLVSFLGEQLSTAVSLQLPLRGASPPSHSSPQAAAATTILLRTLNPTLTRLGGWFPRGEGDVALRSVEGGDVRVVNCNDEVFVAVRGLTRYPVIYNRLVEQ